MPENRYKQQWQVPSSDGERTRRVTFSIGKAIGLSKSLNTLPSYTILPMNLKRAYLLGVCLGDASIFHSTYLDKRRNKTYEKYIFSLVVKDREFVDEVAGITGLKVERSVSKAQTGPSRRYWMIRTQEKKAVKAFIALQRTNIESLSQAEKVEVLRGMFDSDGSATLYDRPQRQTRKPDIRISIAQKRYPDTVAYLLNEFGIRFSTYTHRGGCLSFNMWNGQALKFYDLMGSRLTISRKDVVFKRYFRMPKRQCPRCGNTVIQGHHHRGHYRTQRRLV